MSRGQLRTRRCYPKGISPLPVIHRLFDRQPRDDLRCAASLGLVDKNKVQYLSFPSLYSIHSAILSFHPSQLYQPSIRLFYSVRPSYPIFLQLSLLSSVSFLLAVPPLSCLLMHPIQCVSVIYLHSPSPSCSLQPTALPKMHARKTNIPVQFPIYLENNVLKAVHRIVAPSPSPNIHTHTPSSISWPLVLVTSMC